ncbi:hypothetical protein GCM10009745_39120 [Kribbella yunnanensis]|uniref:histidine kinase n=1 Tax=Kribbella yunnanensis TaxID=190194 RepID=A0ABP4TMW8_9ACTN
MPRLSTAARVTVIAGVIGALLAAGFAFWIRHEVYTSRYEISLRQAQTTLDEMRGDMEILSGGPGRVPSVAYAGTDEYFEIVDSYGRTLLVADGLELLRPGAPPIQPVPRPDEVSGWRGGHYWTAAAPDPRKLQEICGSPTTYNSRRCVRLERLTGRRLETVRVVVPIGAVRKPAPNSIIGRLHGTIGAAIVVSPLEAEDAVAGVDQVLRPALPVAVLLIMLGAYVGTRTALRPVERMRAQAAAISQRNLHERVPVPRTGDVVARLATTLNETLGRLETAAQQQRGFVADAAHELRSPIASLRAILEVANEHPERADWPRVSGTAIEEIRRLQQLADDLLLVARLDAEPESTKQAVDLAELVRRQLARRVDEGPGLTFDAPESAMVAGDPAQLERLVRNLVDNAIRHTRTTVAVGIEQRDGDVVLRIDDDGAGIPEGDRERVFERFTRLDEARSRDAGGAGLGLAIAREIALRHGGTLTVSEAPGGGARFELVLPQV